MIFNGKPLSIREHQLIMLDMMIHFDKYCQAKNLRYFLAGGTLIGAIRHNGFIPWDDDVDIVMPRPDYNFLVQNMQISEEYEIVSLENPHNYYHPFAYCNITDKATIMLEHNIAKQTGKGVFLDVFPLDGLPDVLNKRKAHLNYLLIIEQLFAIGINNAPDVHNIKNLFKSIIHFLEIPLNKVKLGKKIQEKAQLYSYERSNYVAPSVFLTRDVNKLITPKEDYSDFVLFDFETYQFRCPIGYDNILKRQYGDYMKLPPENERCGNHGIEIFKRL